MNNNSHLYFREQPCARGHNGPFYVSSKTCVECHRISQKKWNSKNAERLKESKDKYRLSHKKEHAALSKKWLLENRERHNETARNWRRNNPEKVKRIKQKYESKHPGMDVKNRKEWRRKNADKVKQYKREYHLRTYDKQKEIDRVKRWQKNNRDKYLVLLRNTRARRKASVGTHTLDDLNILRTRQKNRCYWCKSKLTSYHVDHVWPISKGGTNGPENIVLSCPPCNCRKHSKLPYEFGGILL